MNWNDIFDYIDGNLYWKVKRRGSTKIGDNAGSVDSNGYKKVTYMNNEYYAHRIIWEMHNGSIPKCMQIDHINHDRSDNSIFNLRLVSSKVNSKNRSKSKANKSGFTGVYSHRGKWRVRIRVDGKLKCFGVYDDIDSANSAAKYFRDLLGFHKNHGA